MEIKAMKAKTTEVINKYKYMIAVILVGIGLMLIPTTSKKSTTRAVEVIQKMEKVNITDELACILSQIKVSGNVAVYLTTLEGEKTIYQTNENLAETNDSRDLRTDTVTVTDAQRSQNGLITQVNPPLYRGAIVVCEGADDPAVQLAITEAVANVTGLGTNRISVLKMK